jgi:Leucine-rich repeat (LRR) protein
MSTSVATVAAAGYDCEERKSTCTKTYERGPMYDNENDCLQECIAPANAARVVGATSGRRRHKQSDDYLGKTINENETTLQFVTPFTVKNNSDVVCEMSVSSFVSYTEISKRMSIWARKPHNPITNTVFTDAELRQGYGFDLARRVKPNDGNNRKIPDLHYMLLPDGLNYNIMRTPFLIKLRNVVIIYMLMSKQAKDRFTFPCLYVRPVRPFKALEAEGDVPGTYRVGNPDGKYEVSGTHAAAPGVRIYALEMTDPDTFFKQFKDLLFDFNLQSEDFENPWHTSHVSNSTGGFQQLYDWVQPLNAPRLAIEASRDENELNTMLEHLDSEHTADFRKITSLNLRGKEIEELPSVLFNAAQLTSLDISDNSLDNLPAEVGKLELLVSLDVSDNALTRDLNQAIGKLSLLKKLDLSTNMLQSIPDDIGNLIVLDHLNLNYNFLKTVPSTISKLSFLTFLDLGSNAIESVPTGVFSLLALQTLKLDANEIQVIPEGLTKLTNLQDLHLDHNAISEVPAFISKLTGLTRLHLCNNLIDSMPSETEALTKLTHCCLYKNTNRSVFFQNNIKLDTLIKNSARSDGKYVENSTDYIHISDSP